MTRSFLKGPFVAHHILKKLKKLTSQNKIEIIKTWSRASTILPLMVGYTFSVYNGKKHVPLFISESLIGHKLGEFVPTRTFRGHKKNAEQKFKRKA